MRASSHETGTVQRRRRAPLAPKPLGSRARRTNDLFGSHNLNTSRGRRVRDLASAYLSALGNPSDIARQAAIIGAAELQVIAEEARAAALRSGLYDLDQIVRMQGAADRALRNLGIKSTAPRKPPLSMHAQLMQERT